MAVKCIICLCLLTVVQSLTTNVPEVYEVVDEERAESADVRSNKRSQKSELPVFNYKESVQQDPRKIRYAQQQQVDSYLRAYHQEQSRKYQANMRNVEFDRQKKVADPKTIEVRGKSLRSNKSPRLSDGDNVKPMEPGHQVKVLKRLKFGNVLDQQVQASNRKEAKEYAPDDLLQFPRATYFVADPDLILDPKLYAPVQLSYENHPSSNLDALNSLIGKSPNVQLQGLNALIGSEEVKEYTPIKEEVLDVSNPQTKPNIKVIYHQEQPSLLHQINSAEDTKKLYENDYENLQYASQYAFGYKIRDFYSGNDFGHEEVRDGEVAKGHYHVKLPDGRIQNVDYWADPSGYHAKVTYSTVGYH